MFFVGCLIFKGQAFVWPFLFLEIEIMSNKCCKIHPCETSCDPVVPHHMAISGIAGWVWDFCKCAAKKGDKIELTECLLMPGHVVDWVSLTVERGSGVDSPFTLGTEADPERFGEGDLKVQGRGFSDMRELQNVSEKVYLTLGEDVSDGKLTVGIMLHDSLPFGNRESMG